MGSRQPMRVVLFGATGMLGSGTLIECLYSPEVEAVLVVGRRSCGVEHEKLREVAAARPRRGLARTPGHCQEPVSALTMS